MDECGIPVGIGFSANGNGCVLIWSGEWTLFINWTMRPGLRLRSPTRTHTHTHGQWHQTRII